MAKRKFTLSSKKEQSIEKAYLDTALGKGMFTVSLVSCAVLIMGLLAELYARLYQDCIIPICDYADELLFFGSLVSLVCLVFYMKFSSDYTGKATAKRAVRRTVAKTTAKPAAKAPVKELEPVKKAVVKKTVAKPATKTTTKTATKVTTKTTAKTPVKKVTKK